MDNENTVWLSGRLVPWKEATVPLLSHGFSRGSAIFDVFGVHEVQNRPVVLRMKEHLRRFERSAELMGFEIPYSSQEIRQAVAELVDANNMKLGLIKILGYWKEEAVTELVLDSKLDIAIFPIPESRESGLYKAKNISACFSKWRKLHPETVPVRAKACSNYVNGYLARKDAYERGFEVGIMLGTDGFVAEGSIESVFMVHDGVLKTPPLGRILSSITRLSILQAAPALDIPISEEPILPHSLYSADEIFTSHTGIKVSPVDRFEDRTLEAPGPITKQLIDLMENIITGSDERFKDWLEPLS
jgi:branched-chain amino acid aminotransferase